MLFLYYGKKQSDNLHMNVGEQDYLNLELLSRVEGKRRLLKFDKGYSEKGYLDMCKYGNGTDVGNFPILATIQKS